MPKRRRKRWTASGYDKALGRKIHLGTYDSRTEALDAEADHRLKSRPTDRETCDDFARRWMRDYPRPRESTRRTNTEHVRAFARDFKGVRLGAVDRPTARRWALQHKGDLSTVRAMFGDALRDGLIEFNPFAELRLPGSRGRKNITALSETDLTALAEFALDPRMELGDYGAEYRSMVLFAGYVGLRPGELFALRQDDLRGQLATIERSYSSHSHQITTPKNGRARTVIVPPAAQDALLTVPKHPSGLLFTTPEDKQWTASLHHRYWTRLRLVANRPGLDFYELRHAAATMLLERGVTPWDVAIQLGHTDGGRLVMELYGHPSEAGARSRLLAAWDAQTGADAAQFRDHVGTSRRRSELRQKQQLGPIRDDPLVRILMRVSPGALASAIGTVLLAGCGGQQSVKPKAIGFEPTIVGCSGINECASPTERQVRESRVAANHLCPADKPEVLIKADGSLLCVARLPSAGPTAHWRVDPERGASTGARGGCPLQGRKSSCRGEWVSGVPSHRRMRVTRAPEQTSRTSEDACPQRQSTVRSSTRPRRCRRLATCLNPSAAPLSTSSHSCVEAARP